MRALFYGNLSFCLEFLFLILWFRQFHFDIGVGIILLYFGLSKEYKYDGGNNVEPGGNQEYCSPCSNC